MHMNMQPVKPASDDIARLAYLIWEQEGKPHGREVEHWLQAKSILTVATQEKLPTQITTDVSRLPRPAHPKKGHRRDGVAARLAA
jgi:hypothetical protein